MINIMSQSGKTTYGLIEYVCDSEAEINSLPINNAPGSTAYVIDSGNIYMLSGGTHTWKKMDNTSSSGNSDDTSKLKLRISQLEEQLTEKETELEQFKQNEIVIRQDLTNANSTITNLQETVQKKNEELAAANKKVEKLSDVKVEGDTLVLPDDLIDTVEES